MSQSKTWESIELLDPRAESESKPRTLSPRGATLRGKRLGLLDNSKPNAALLLHEIGRLAKERLGVSEVVEVRKGKSGEGAGQLLQALEQRCDVVITASGD